MEIQQPKNIFLLPGQQVKFEQNIQNTKINRNVFSYNQAQITPKFSGFLINKVSSHDKKNIVNLYTNPQIYIPVVGDYVIGVIKMKTQDYYYVDINTSTQGHLGTLEFNGATKRNKPNLNIGNCVYCQVKENQKFLAPKLSCITNEKKQWATGETKLGQLKKGNIVYVQPQRFKYLEKKVQIFSKFLSFEIALGKNGYIWLNTKRIKNLILLSNLIQMINKGDIQQMIGNLGDLIEK